MGFEVRIKPKRSRPVIEIEPVEYRFKPIKKRLAVIDSETDPFALDPITGRAREVFPFTCGFYDGVTYRDFWGPDCFQQFFAWLDTQDEEFLIVAHNGGNFDFYFFLDEMDNDTAPFIMDGRIVKMFCHGQEFRDSYKLIPVALDQYKKTEINYSKFERDVREEHKGEILSYQRDDCINLYELVQPAYEEFGDKLTMASVALPMLRSFHGFNEMSASIDEQIRPFYFGGRCEAFEVGELTPKSSDDFMIVDVNSMYPSVMRNFAHPVSSIPQFERRITSRTHFARINATSRGALPVRQDNGSLAFPHKRGTFYASIHEIHAGKELGLLDIHSVDYSVYFEVETSFDKFVDYFYARRLEADANGDKIRKLFWKLVLNSSYGKLAQDPRRYESFLFDPDNYPLPMRCETCARGLKLGELCDGCFWGVASFDGWRPHTARAGKVLFSRPQTRARDSSFFNVATAASITAAARAQLLRGLALAQRPLYCDTDSIICEAFSGDIDHTRLGAWDVEARGNRLYIAGKKLYALFSDGDEIKKASKGVKLTAEQIARVAAGEVIHYAHDVPKFNLDGTYKTTERTIARTK